MTKFHLAQVNIARLKTPFDDPAMSGFVARLDEINGLAESSPGFVWRLQTAEGNATYLRPYDDDRILFNMSVWETLEHLRQFVYGGDHLDVMRKRHHWFEKIKDAYLVLWWLPAGQVPSVDEGKKRLAHLETHGPTPFAFTFRSTFLPDEASLQTPDWSSFEPCPAL